MEGQVWDVAFTSSGSGGMSMQVTIPVAIARALRERGYNRTKVTLTADGIVLRPYAGKGKRGTTVEIPDWGDA